MHIDHHLYHLKPFHALNAHHQGDHRLGALLRVNFGEGIIGYADCHPWPEIGDLPLETQLYRLKHGIPTNLARCSIRFAHLDALARQKRQPLLSPRNIPKSHYLITNLLSWTEGDLHQAIKQGYTHVKLKLGRKLEEEINQILGLFSQGALKVRLDFNEALTYDSFQAFLRKIAPLQPHIDFIEDPFPFHAKQWEQVQKQGWILACDRHAVHASHHPEAAQVLVIKPAIQPKEDWTNWTQQRRVVTSYLDHPFGQLTAAYVASLVDPQRKEVHGLLTHHAYHLNAFSHKLSPPGPDFKVPEGVGFGFESELETLSWKSLT